MLLHLYVFNKSKNFTSDCWIQMPPVVPVNQNWNSETKKNNSTALFHAEIFKAIACWEHPGFFKVNPLVHHTTQSSADAMLSDMQKQSHTYTPSGQTGQFLQTSNYELFNRNNFNIRYWSWNYRGCWHQTCPPMGTRKNIFVQPIPITRHGCPVLLFFVTTSLCQDWVICAPAAFLRCGSHSSGSLSGIKP